MSAVYGAWLLAFAAIAFAWAYGQYRRPQPATWTDWELVTNVVILTIIGAAALGAGYIVRAVVTWETLSFGIGQIALIAAAIAAAVPAARVLSRPARMSGASTAIDRAATIHPMPRPAPAGPAETDGVLSPRDPTKPRHSRKAA